MKRAITSMLGVLGAALLLGCDGGNELLARAAAAEAAGSFAEATTLYRSVCEKASSRCPFAGRRAEQLRLKEAGKALDDGDYRKAKGALDAALASTDAGVKRAAEAMSKTADLEKGLAWQEASTSPDQDAALATIEAVAAAGVTTSPAARAWIEKNRPRILLARVKAACAPEGPGSCADRGAELARRHPASPEHAEAEALIAADYARIYPLLQQAEQKLGGQAFRSAKYAAVEEQIRNCMTGAGATQAGCEQEVGLEPQPPQERVRSAWQQVLDDIHDAHFTEPLAARWGRASSGDYDAVTWPKPAGKKK